MTGRTASLARASFGVRPADAEVVGCTVREAVFVRLAQGGRAGFGECAPLGASSTETLAACVRALEAWAHAGAPDAVPFDMPAPARFAAASALEMLAGFGSRQGPMVPVAAYWGAGPNMLDARALDGLMGARSVKVKIGRAEARDERRMLECLLESLPGACLRLDGNRSMRIDACTALVAGLPRERIEYFEEPIEDPAMLGALRDATGIHVGLDELIVDPHPDAASLRDRLTAEGHACAWVLRMSRIGTTGEVRALMHRAASLGCDPVLSTAYESSWTILLGAHLAAEAGATRRPHGLGTARVLANDACRPAAPVDGCIPCIPLPVPLEGGW
jgi:o-succinylbenzoate synthase